jgi:hypothetical protein
MQTDTEVGAVDQFFDRTYERLKVLPGRVASSIRSWRFNHEQAALEQGLAGIIETANSHRAKGLPKGSPAYIALRDKAASKIENFCQRWNVDRSLVEAEAPALKDLYALSVPDKGNPAALKLLAGFLGGILSLVLIGAASGLVTAAHNWVVLVLSHLELTRWAI